MKESAIPGLKLTHASWRPCWRNDNKRISLAAIVFGAYFPPTWPPCLCLIYLKRLIANHQLIELGIKTNHNAVKHVTYFEKKAHRSSTICVYIYIYIYIYIGTKFILKISLKL
jgi:hypothetical protein